MRTGATCARAGAVARTTRPPSRDEAHTSAGLRTPLQAEPTQEMRGGKGSLPSRLPFRAASSDPMPAAGCPPRRSSNDHRVPEAYVIGVDVWRDARVDET